MTILQKILEHSEIGMTMRYVKIAEHYNVEAVVKLEKYRAVKMQEAEEKIGMVQWVPRIPPPSEGKDFFSRWLQVAENIGRGARI